MVVFVYRMVLRRLKLMLFGYLYPFIWFCFSCGLNVGACHSVKAPGKSFMLTVPHACQSVFVWDISSLHLLFSSPRVCHPCGSVLGSINSFLHAQSSSARFLKDKEFSLPSSRTTSSVTNCGFLAVDSSMNVSFPSVSCFPVLLAGPHRDSGAGCHNFWCPPLVWWILFLNWRFTSNWFN